MEMPPGSPENRPQIVGVALLERALDVGYPLRFREAHADLGPVYSERNKIIEDAEAIVRNRFQDYADAAAEYGIPVPAFAEWEDTITDAQVTDLREKLRPERVRMQMLDGFEEFIANKDLMKKLLPQQRDAMHGARRFMESATRMRAASGLDGTALNGKSGYVDMPTGTGKTGAFIAMARAAKMKESPDDPIKVLIITPTRNIQAQTIGDKKAPLKDRTGFAKFWPEATVTEYNGDAKDVSPITVITNASFNQKVQDGTMRAGSGDEFDFDLILVDETHTDLGENISQSIRDYYQNKVTIGFSATPDFHDEKRTAHVLQHEIFKLPLRTAIEAGRLAPVSAEHRELTLQFDESKLPPDTPGESRKQRKRMIQDAYFRARLEDSLKDIKKAIVNGDKVIVRCPPGGGKPTAYATKAAARLRELMVTKADGTYQGKILAASVSGTMKPRDVQTVIKDFNEGRAQVLTYVDIINMGTDLPPAKLFVDLYPMKASIPVVQGIGRVLRLVYDKITRRPRRAKVISYQDPHMEGQYTCLDALDMKPGEASLSYKAPYKPRYSPEDQDSYELREISAISTVTAVGQMAIEHGAGVQYEMPPAGGVIGFYDACDLFEVSPEIAAPFLADLDLNDSSELPPDEYEAFFDMVRMTQEDMGQDAVGDIEEASEITGDIDTVVPEEKKSQVEPVVDSLVGKESAPRQKTPDRPESGYTSIDVFAAYVNWNSTERNLLKQLRKGRAPLEEFRDFDGKVKFFLPDNYIF